MILSRNIQYRNSEKLPLRPLWTYHIPFRLPFQASLFHSWQRRTSGGYQSSKFWTQYCWMTWIGRISVVCMILRLGPVIVRTCEYLAFGGLETGALTLYIQLCNMSLNLLHMPRPLWSHWTACPCVSPFVHGEHVQHSSRNMYVLS